MNNITLMKKQNLLEILATTEDERLINFLNSFIRGYQDKSEEDPKVKVITTEDELKITKAIAQNRIKEAASTLDGELYIIEKDIEKILFLLQELQEQYFWELDAKNPEDHEEILYGYERNSIYTDIVRDNAIDIKRTLEKINCSGGSENE